jgi:signal transduction histidine kinase
MDWWLLLFSVVFGALLIKSVTKEVSQRKKMEELALELEAANKKLALLDEARKEFLSFASHQLKTPMTVIKGYATLAADPRYTNSPEKINKVVAKIGEATDQMYRLISNFLSLRAIEEGKISYIFKPVDIGQLVAAVVEEFAPAASQKGLTLISNLPTNSLVVKIDEVKFRQVIQNLVDNAIKYTDRGWVKVEIQDGSSEVTLKVSDSGRGMSQETRQHLFEQFFRERGNSLTTQGTGLGLYIAKEIVKAHGGEIWAESEGVGKGTAFFIRLKK